MALLSFFSRGKPRTEVNDLRETLVHCVGCRGEEPHVIYLGGEICLTCNPVIRRGIHIAGVPVSAAPCGAM